MRAGSPDSVVLAAGSFCESHRGSLPRQRPTAALWVAPPTMATRSGPFTMLLGESRTSFATNLSPVAVVLFGVACSHPASQHEDDGSEAPRGATRQDVDRIGVADAPGGHVPCPRARRTRSGDAENTDRGAELVASEVRTGFETDPSSTKGRIPRQSCTSRLKRRCRPMHPSARSMVTLDDSGRLRASSW